MMMIAILIIMIIMMMMIMVIIISIMTCTNGDMYMAPVANNKVTTFVSPNIFTCSNFERVSDFGPNSARRLPHPSSGIPFGLMLESNPLL